MGKKLIKLFSDYISACVFMFGIAYMFWWYKPDGTVDTKVFLFILAPLLVFVGVSIKWITLNALEDKDKNNLPKLKIIEENRYIFEASNLFSTGVVVSLYYEGNYEKFIGWGKVETVTSTKAIQVIVFNFEPNYDEMYVNKNKDKIILKPTIPYELLNNKTVETKEDM